MLLAFLSILASSGKPLGNVLIGNWTGSAKYTSGQEIPETLNFIVRMGESANYLRVENKDMTMLINVSSTDLSGNISFVDSVYYFNFSEKLTHYVSTEVDLGAYGKAFCAIASYQTLHCTHISSEGAITSYVFIKDVINASQPWVVRNSKFIFMILAMGAMQLLYQFVVKKFTASSLFGDVKAAAPQESKEATPEEASKKIKSE